MNIPLTPGSDYLLDGKTLVKVIKPATRSNTTYIVETPGPSIQSVERDRLKAIEVPEVVKA